jgi:probable rRNA maturation factor
MTVTVELQIETDDEPLPDLTTIQAWAEAALEPRDEAVELVIRVVGENESADLNRRYRGKDGPTNVLSFAFTPPPPVQSALLGDLVICAPVVRREAEEQGKTASAHWAHIVIHGTLHLLGYDHQEATDADRMESREREILQRLGFSDPYENAKEP